jgi:hypothetical protein
MNRTGKERIGQGRIGKDRVRKDRQRKKGYNNTIGLKRKGMSG